VLVFVVVEERAALEWCGSAGEHRAHGVLRGGAEMGRWDYRTEKGVFFVESFLLLVQMCVTNNFTRWWGDVRWRDNFQGVDVRWRNNIERGDVRWGNNIGRGDVGWRNNIERGDVRWRNSIERWSMRCNNDVRRWGVDIVGSDMRWRNRSVRVRWWSARW
jgi:hypothetical protein